MIREFWRVIPHKKTNLKGKRQQDESGRILLSCRSHFFRSIWDQNAFFTAGDRDGICSDRYRSLELLPFDEQQIKTYLGKNFGEDQAERILSLLEEIHNLREMAERPYTLSLIRELIPELERHRNTGSELRTLDLYEMMVERWLQRDNPKHSLNPLHKRVLMEDLAAAMWRSGSNQWPIAKAEAWLDQALAENTTFNSLYAPTVHDREILKEDFRNATFIVRSGKDSFRFAHTSVQEYFIACYLHRALLEHRPDDWEMQEPSREALIFLGQAISKQDTDICIRHIAKYVAYLSGRNQ